MALQEPRLQTPEHPVPLAGMYKVIKRLNRNTTWVATGLLGAVIFAALVLALLECHPKADDLAKEASQTSGSLLLNANPTTPSNVVGSIEKSTGEIASGQATSVDRGLTPEISHHNGQANATSWSPAHGPDSAQVIRSKIPTVRYRTFVRHRIVDVKMRLLALWRESLQREKSRGWTRNKIIYTAATIH